MLLVQCVLFPLQTVSPHLKHKNICLAGQGQCFTLYMDQSLGLPFAVRLLRPIILQAQSRYQKHVGKLISIVPNNLSKPQEERI